MVFWKRTISNEQVKTVVFMIVYDSFELFLDSLNRSENENKSWLEIEKQVRLTYPLAYRIGSDIYDIVTREMEVDSYKCEKVFLVLHIQRLL